VARHRVQLRRGHPPVGDVAHDQGAVELDTTVGKGGAVGEVAGVHLIDLERLEVPGVGAELQALEAVAVAGGRVAGRAGFEEVRRRSLQRSGIWRGQHHTHRCPRRRR